MLPMTALQLRWFRILDLSEVGRTYKLPSRKIAVSASFRDLSICSLQRYGSGRNKSARLVKTSGQPVT